MSAKVILDSSSHKVQKQASFPCQLEIRTQTQSLKNLNSVANPHVQSDVVNNIEWINYWTVKMKARSLKQGGQPEQVARAKGI